MDHTGGYTWRTGEPKLQPFQIQVMVTGWQPDNTTWPRTTDREIKQGWTHEGLVALLTEPLPYPKVQCLPWVCTSPLSCGGHCCTEATTRELSVLARSSTPVTAIAIPSTITDLTDWGRAACRLGSISGEMIPLLRYIMPYYVCIISCIP